MRKSTRTTAARGLMLVMTLACRDAAAPPAVPAPVIVTPASNVIVSDGAETALSDAIMRLTPALEDVAGAAALARALEDVVTALSSADPERIDQRAAAAEGLLDGYSARVGAGSGERVELDAIGLAINAAKEQNR